MRPASPEPSEIGIHPVNPGITQVIRDFLQPDSPVQERGKVVCISTPVDERAQMAENVLEGLMRREQKSIPSMYLYDENGSRLFSKITALPEYYLTRSEVSLLGALAKTPKIGEILFPLVRQSPSGFLEMESECHLIELGSGTATKTRLLLDAWFASGETRPLTYIPIDISETTLNRTVDTLLAEYPRLRVLGLQGQYEEALASLPTEGNQLALFLGATMGNFPTLAEQGSFIQALSRELGPGGRLLVGYDRSPNDYKSRDEIEHAYNDPQGLVREMNLNLLTRLNEQLQANFDLSQWRHHTFYNDRNNELEMSLESKSPQTVTFGVTGQAIHFAGGERILTLISRKFSPDGLIQWFQGLGYRHHGAWTDGESRVGLLLQEVV